MITRAGLVTTVMACGGLFVACGPTRPEVLKSPEPRATQAASPRQLKVPALPAAPQVTSPTPEPASAPVVAKPKGQISEMDIGTLFQLQGENKAFLVDVRPGFFHNLEHIPGAISLPVKKFDEQFPAVQSQLDAALAAGKIIVLYCTDENCPDGRRTATKLAKKGYSTSVYKGGWKEWKASGL